MSVIDTLIFDRTQSDITNDTDKAYIDYKDLNRVEEAVKYLSELLNKYSYENKVNAKIDWKMSEFRKVEDVERIRSNYEVLKSAFAYKFEVPEFKWETIESANYIEKILANIDELIKSMEQYFIYSGVSNCSQSRIWQQRFRMGSSWVSLRYSLDKYNQEWNTVASPSEENGTLPTDVREKISTTLNLWNNKINYLDSLVGVIS